MAFLSAKCMAQRAFVRTIAQSQRSMVVDEERVASSSLQVSAKHVDQVMNELFVAEERWMEGENHGECRSATPPPPILPWWFTPECGS